MKYQKNKITYYRIRAISPVLTASGNRMVEGFDFIRDNQGTVLVDVERFFHHVGDRIDRFDDRANIAENAAKMGIDVGKSCSRGKYNHLPSAREIHEFNRDAFDRPLLAGSSLKGAIRTVIFCEALASASKEKVMSGLRETLDRARGQRRPNSRRAAEATSKFLMGRSPNHDILRVLQVGDAVLPNRSLDLYDVGIYSVMRDNQFHLDQRKKICAEMLRPGAVAHTRLITDEQESMWKDRDLNFARYHELVHGLAGAAREYARNWIETELGLLRGKGVGGLIGFYEKEIAPLAERDGGSFPLHIGWGSGWRGTTGDWLAGVDDQIKRDLLNVYRVGRYANRYPQIPFPKTRKVVEYGGSMAAPGWLLMEPVTKEEALVTREAIPSEEHEGPQQTRETRPASLDDLKSLKETFG